MEFYDKTGRTLELFDIVKVFHFTGARRKKHYMYKQVVEKIVTKKPGVEYFKLSHLSACGTSYALYCNDKINLSYEIVQGFKDGVYFEDREKQKELPKTERITSDIKINGN